MNVDKSEQRIRRMFGEIAARYDFLNHLLSGGTDYYWRWRTVRAVPPSGRVPVLDICTGTGDLAFAYFKKGKGNVPVVGADFTHEMLTRANEKARSLIVSNSRSPVQFIEADAQQLPFASDQFQIVSVAFGLRNVTETRRGLAEMIRVCAPGGRVVVLEFAMPANRLLRGIYGWYFRNVLPKIGQLLARNRQSAYNYLPESVSEFPHGEALAEVMRDCGLGPVDWRPLTFGVAALYVGTKPPSNSAANLDNDHLHELRPADSCAISS